MKRALRRFAPTLTTSGVFTLAELLEIFRSRLIESEASTWTWHIALSPAARCLGLHSTSVTPRCLVSGDLGTELLVPGAVQVAFTVTLPRLADTTLALGTAVAVNTNVAVGEPAATDT